MKIKIDGVEGIQKVLESLPREIQKKALVDSFTQGANQVRDEARSQAASLWPDGFAQAITVARPSAKQRRRSGQRETVVVVALKKGKFSRLAHLFEFGTADRYQENGRFTGKIIAAPALRPALDKRAQAAVTAIAQSLEKNIDILVARLRRGQKLSLSQRSRNDFSG